MASGTIIQMNRTMTEGATISRAAAREDCVATGISDSDGRLVRGRRVSSGQRENPPASWEMRGSSGNAGP